MRFGSPTSFWLLLTLPLLVGFFLYALQRKRKMLRRFAGVDMLRKMSQNISRSRQLVKASLQLAVVGFIIVALTRPQYGTKMELMTRKGLDVVIAADVSVSMLAEDIKPTRMARAKHEMGRFVDGLTGDRIALVAFAGEAFLQCPLTTDYGAFKIFLDELSPDLIPTQGTSMGAALETALKAFDPKERKYRVVVLLTDGEDHTGRAEKAAEKAAQEGVIIYTVGIGSRGGVPIPLKDGRGRVSYKTDGRGNVVTTRLDEVLLQKIALATGGKYFHASPGSFELKKVLEEISAMEKRKLEGEHFTQFEERFQWPLALALLLLVGEMLLSDRRKRRRAWEGRFT